MNDSGSCSGVVLKVGVQTAQLFSLNTFSYEALRV